MKTPTTHKGWMILIADLHDDAERKWVNNILDDIYPDFEKCSTIHRTKCSTCNGNIIKFDELLNHQIYLQDLSAQTFEFHNKNCLRKQKLEKLNVYLGDN